MIMPSLLTWVIGAAVLVVLSVVLRYVANEAHELARSRGRASVAAEPESEVLQATQPSRDLVFSADESQPQRHGRFIWKANNWAGGNTFLLFLQDLKPLKSLRKAQSFKGSAAELGILPAAKCERASKIE